MEFQEVMRGRFTEVIESATGRSVIGFRSGNQQHPDLMCEVFILAPTDPELQELREVEAELTAFATRRIAAIEDAAGPDRNVIDDPTGPTDA